MVALLGAAALLGAVAAAAQDLREPRVHLSGSDVRSVAQDPEGTIWMGTARGAFVLASEGTRPEAVAVDAPARAVVNDIVAHQSGTIWFCTDRGVVGRAGEDVTAINAMEIPVQEARKGETLHELGRVLCGTAVGESVFFGMPRAIVQHFPPGRTWLARTEYLAWGAISRNIAMGRAPINGCREIVRDAEGMLWALTDDGLLSANRRWRQGPFGRGWCWMTGHESFGDGDDRVVIHFWQLMAGGPRLGGREVPAYGAPAAIALDALGSIRILTVEGHILSLPDIPDVTAGRVWKTWTVLPVAAIANVPESRPWKACALAYAGDRVAVAGTGADEKPIVLLRTAPGRDFVVEWMGQRATEIRDLLMTEEGHVFIATSSGLVELAPRLPVSGRGASWRGVGMFASLRK